MQLDVLIIELDHLGPEFDTDGDLVLLSESLVDELEKEAGLSDPGVPNDDHLEHIRIGHLDYYYSVGDESSE